MEKKILTTLEYVLKHINNIGSNIKELKQGQELIESRLNALEELIRNENFKLYENPDTQDKNHQPFDL